MNNPTILRVGLGCLVLITVFMMMVLGWIGYSLGDYVESRFDWIVWPDGFIAAYFAWACGFSPLMIYPRISDWVIEKLDR